MKKTKIIHVDKAGRETVVASFKTINEASACRDLLQAKCADQSNVWYYTELNGNRQGPDSLTRQLQYIESSVLTNIRLWLS